MNSKIRPNRQIIIQVTMLGVFFFFIEDGSILRIWGCELKNMGV